MCLVVRAGSSRGCCSALLSPPSLSNCDHSTKIQQNASKKQRSARAVAITQNQVLLHQLQGVLTVHPQAFPGGFAWECLDVLAGPPKVTFK
jgi:hypothetical protein